MIKSVKMNQLAPIKAEDVKPGMVIVEGLIFDVDKDEKVVWMRTATSSTWQYVGKDVQVLFRVDKDAFDAIRDTYKREMS